LLVINVIFFANSAIQDPFSLIVPHDPTEINAQETLNKLGCFIFLWKPCIKKDILPTTNFWTV